jgi:hypothetical protein
MDIKMARLHNAVSEAFKDGTGRDTRHKEGHSSLQGPDFDNINEYRQSMNRTTLEQYHHIQSQSHNISPVQHQSALKLKPKQNAGSHIKSMKKYAAAGHTGVQGPLNTIADGRHHRLVHSNFNKSFQVTKDPDLPGVSHKSETLTQFLKRMEQNNSSLPDDLLN